jgi:hypothetical protein
LILVLSVYDCRAFGPWVLAIGLMRYAFVAAGRPLPWLRGPLSPTRAGKTIAATQGIVLVVAAAQITPRWTTYALLAVALAALTWSFARDVGRLWRARPGQS